MEYMNRRIGWIIKLLSFIVCFGLIYFKDLNFEFLRGLENELRFAGITSGVLLLLDLLLFSFENRKRLKTILKSYNPLKRRRKLRLSFAYFLRIDVESYMLVFNDKSEQYQPVGGVYKYDPKNTAKLFEKCGIERDIQTPVTNGEYDLRLFLYDRFRLHDILRWFEKDENRESDPWREFHEELVATGILSRDEFYYIDYTKKFEHNTGIFRDLYRNGQESLKVFTVFELNLTNKKHKDAFDVLKKSENHDIIWVSADEIKEGTCERWGKQIKISRTSRLLLNYREDPRDV
jgi:hypothetical protein